MSGGERMTKLLSVGLMVLAALPALAQLAVEVHFLPAREDRRFLLREARLHGEVRYGEEDGGLVVWLVGHLIWYLLALPFGPRLRPIKKKGRASTGSARTGEKMCPVH